MSKQASPAVIGAFVIGAVALLLTALVLFGTGRFFADRHTFVLFFDGSVRGLMDGAPVVFRGVPIGTVSDVALIYDPSDQERLTRTAVTIEIDDRRIVRLEDVPTTFEERVQLLLKRGAAAQLQSKSFITGELLVYFDFYPDKERRRLDVETENPQLPTVRSTFEELAERVEALPIEDIVKEAHRSLEGIAKLVNDPRLDDSLQALNELLRDVQKVVSDLGGQVAPLSSSLLATAEAARGALVQAEETLALEEGVPGELAIGLQSVTTAASGALVRAEETLAMRKGVASQVAAKLQEALAQATETLATLESTLAADSQLSYDVATTLQEFAAAARSLRILTDYLAQNPDAILRGKGGSGGQ